MPMKTQPPWRQLPRMPFGAFLSDFTFCCRLEFYYDTLPKCTLISVACEFKHRFQLSRVSILMRNIL